MRSGARKFITAAAVTAAVGAGIGVASSAGASEPATAATHSSTVQPRIGWHYKIAYDDVEACKVAGATYAFLHEVRDYACEGPYNVAGEDLWELWLYY